MGVNAEPEWAGLTGVRLGVWVAKGEEVLTGSKREELISEVCSSESDSSAAMDDGLLGLVPFSVGE